jgi:signal transduction histidine kinase
MADSPVSGKQDVALGLSSARQTVELLRTQLRANMVEKDYWAARLDELSRLLSAVADEYQNNDQNRRLAALYQVSRALGSSLQLDEVLNQVMDSIIALTGAERGFLMLFDEDKALQVMAARNMERESLNEEEFEISRSVIRLVADTGEQVVTTNASTDPRFSSKVSVVTHQLRSIQCVPLRTRGNIIGAIYVDNRIRTGVFDEADLEMLSAFATQAAIAIENAQLFTRTDQALGQRLDELSKLQEIDQQLNETLDFVKVMDLTLSWAVKVTGADNGAIGLIDLEEGETRIVAKHGKTPAGVSSMLNDDYTLDGHREDNLTVPIQREGRVIGVIGLDRIGGRFPPESFAFVTRLADHAAIAIENAQLYEAVKRANETKNEFVSVMTHELRVPMTSIKGYTDMIPLVGQLTDQQNNYLGIIRNNIDRMTLLVSDLSDISRIESGKLSLDIMDDVRTSDVLNDLLPALRNEIERRQHTINIEAPADLPPVRVDPKRLSQVLTNLISNAYKYTPNGGTITIRAMRENGIVRCEVSDTGVGMSEEQLAKLFTKFWRADDPHVREQPGSGLGLTIAKNLIEMQGGEMTVTSEKGKGTTFSFTMPVSE